MKKLTVIILTLLFVGTVAFAASSTATQPVTMTVSEVVLMGVSPNNNTFTLNVVQPVTAGDPPTGSSNSTKYLNYTAVTAGGQTRNISVGWNDATRPPAGTELHVQSAAPTGTGAVGSSNGDQTVPNAGSNNIVISIGSCYTGTGNAGAQLTYTLVVSAPGSLVQGASTNVTVLLTLTDGS